MKLVFISDLHLSADTFNKNQLFYNLMAKWQHEVDALYILGDLFDSWLGDDDHTTFSREMEQTFKKFSATKPIYFISGNHDFALGKDFAKQSGITILPDCSVITAGTNRILLSHGDVFCTLDKDYQMMKRILRNPVLLFILKRIPISWRYKIKEKLELESSKSFNTKPAATYHVVDDTVRKIATKHNANIVIHGHTHQPDRYVIDNLSREIIRFEIPDWADRPPGGYVLLDNDSIKIHIP